MSQEQFWVSFSKKLSGEASAEELGSLETLIREHPEWQFAIQNLEDLWKYQADKDPVAGEDAYMLHLHRMEELNISLKNIPGKAMAVRPKKRITGWYWAAATLLLLAGLFGIRTLFSGITRGSEVAGQVNEISTRPGSKSKVQLPDGSVVWLNAGSKLVYNKNFGIETREVTLTGEGFFDVTKNKEKPFIISTSSIKIKVLGTAFNVKAYPEDKQTETSLIRGSIEVTIRNRPNDKIILSPSEKLVVENDMARVESGSVEKIKKTGNIERTSLPGISTLMSVNKLKYNPADSTVAEIQWVNNKLVFRDESFSELAVRMERWYDVQIDITDPLIAEERLNGIFDSETISQALDALKEFIPFKYEKDGNKIIIHR
ncbi:MAG: FecR family protein [Sphingobacteriales bacterium]|nr:FecR family protein [Sphingobacteriales bacterium]